MSEEAKKYETTAEHFSYFKAQCQVFIKFFGLYDWKVVFEHKSGKDGSLAACRPYVTDKMAVIYLSPDWDEWEPTNADLRQVAFHEVCEMLLSDIHGAAHDTEFTPRQRENEMGYHVHALIRRMENCVLPLIK
jgi:hypothetical protein